MGSGSVSGLGGATPPPLDKSNISSPGLQNVPKNLTKSQPSERGEAFKHSMKVFALRFGGVAAGLVGVALAPISLTAGTVIGTIMGFSLGVSKTKKTSNTPFHLGESSSQILKEETIEGVKCGALSFFLLAKMAFQDAKLLNQTWKSEHPDDDKTAKKPKKLPFTEARDPIPKPLPGPEYTGL